MPSQHIASAPTLKSLSSSLKSTLAMPWVVGLGPQGSTSAYKIAEGEYVLTVNLESSMLIVTLPTTPVIPGDINGDGIVNVSDVTELVNVILATAKKNDACDVDADGTITVSDVTALVNLIIQ